MITLDNGTDGKPTDNTVRKLSECLKAMLRRLSGHITEKLVPETWHFGGRTYTAVFGQGSCQRYRVTATVSNDGSEPQGTYVLRFMQLSDTEQGPESQGGWTWKPTPMEDFVIGRIGEEQQPASEKPRNYVDDFFSELYSIFGESSESVASYESDTVREVCELDRLTDSLASTLEMSAAEAIRRLGGTFCSDSRLGTTARMTDDGVAVRFGEGQETDFSELSLDDQVGILRTMLEELETEQPF